MTMTVDFDSMRKVWHGVVRDNASQIIEAIEAPRYATILHHARLIKAKIVQVGKIIR